LQQDIWVKKRKKGFLIIEVTFMKIQRMSASTFRITSHRGKIIMLDPWLVNDPIWPLEERDPKKLAQTDIVAITHGHFDHYPGVFEIAKANSDITVIAVFELAFHLMAEGIKNVRPMGIGGTLTVEGIKFSAVSCAHTSSLLDLSTGKSTWVGLAVGYVIELENGLRIYACGDTGLHSDMKLVAEYYKPDIALVPISNAGFVMDAEQAVYAVTQLIKPRYVIPFHDFPEPSEAADPQGMEKLLQFLPQSSGSLGAGKRFLEMMEKHPEYKVFYLAIGQSMELT
jgi:L-ascorbate metabolism protein UlaG (beta-lactamase superfamily)